MKLIMNKNSIDINKINFIHKKKHIKLIYDLNNVYMNGIFMRIHDYKSYKNNNYIYITLNDDDLKIINDIINYIEQKLNINVIFKNDILKIKNDSGKQYIDLNINNIKKFDNNFMLYVYN